MAEENEQGEEQGAEPASEDEASGGGKKKIIFLAAGILVLLGAGGGAFVFLSGGDSEAEEKKEVVTEEESKPEPEEEEAEEKEGEEKKDESAEKGKEEKSLQEKLEDSDESEDGEAFGRTLALKPFQVNLGNPLENRYIRIEVTFEYRGGDEQKTELDKRKPQLRDAVLSIVSRKTREFLLAPDGKDQLRKEILIRVNRYMSKPIDAVYITDMLIE